MPNLPFEREQLKLADVHIAIAERDVAEMEAVLARQRELGADVEASEEAVAAARRGLEVFRDHRALIARLIEDMEAGRLPHTSGPV